MEKVPLNGKSAAKWEKVPSNGKKFHQMGKSSVKKVKNKGLWEKVRSLWEKVRSLWEKVPCKTLPDAPFSLRQILTHNFFPFQAANGKKIGANGKKFFEAEPSFEFKSLFSVWFPTEFLISLRPALVSLRHQSNSRVFLRGFQLNFSFHWSV